MWHARDVRNCVGPAARVGVVGVGEVAFGGRRERGGMGRGERNGEGAESVWERASGVVAAPTPPRQASRPMTLPPAISRKSSSQPVRRA